MKLFKIYFSNGEAQDSEQITVNHFMRDRKSSENGQLKWLLILANDGSEAMAFAERAYARLTKRFLPPLN